MISRWVSVGKSTKVSRCWLGWAATSSPASLVAMMGNVGRATAGRREGDAVETKRAPQGHRRCREEMSERFGEACRPRAHNLPMESGEKRRCDARTTEWDCGAKRLQQGSAPRLEIDRIMMPMTMLVSILYCRRCRESRDGRRESVMSGDCDSTR